MAYLQNCNAMFDKSCVLVFDLSISLHFPLAKQMPSPSEHTSDSSMGIAKFNLLNNDNVISEIS